MKFQLVLQFPSKHVEDFDKLVELEELLEDRLGDTHILDGHDFGSGEMNIFIHTNDPNDAFLLAQDLINPVTSLGFKAAFRKQNSETYEWLFPADSNEDFEVV